ncbi:HlyD family secretion protein [Rhizobium taibaishanense]|uniref:HlyD family secretion protein n=1 Tax=Allorhizobium taibaishanense TaxID=887144 RepID=A0A7W6MSU2_9HYPH|nr:HlyD family secretion protein [Allorhizobium taibaishanense]
MTDPIHPVLPGIARATSRLAPVVLGIALLLPLSSAAVAESVPAQSAPPPADSQLPAIVVAEAGTATLTDKVIGTGSIKAVEEIYVQPEVDGLAIRNLLADVGDKVKAGQVLATLDGDSLILQKAQYAANQAKAEASLAQNKIQLIDAQASAAEAERQLTRGQSLVTGGTISTAQVQQYETSAINARNKVDSARQAITIAEAELKVVISQVADLDLKLARTDIKAPFGGLITARNARIGAIAAGSGQQLFTIIREGKIELVAEVSESDMQKMQVGQPAEITIAGQVKPISGHVRLISPAISATTRLGDVHVLLDDSDAARQGMYASAVITVASASGIALPLSAIDSSKAGSFTRVVEKGVVRQVKIETGIVENGMIQVTSGIKTGDLVVLKAGAFVRDGDRVRPVKEGASHASAEASGQSTTVSN